MTTPVPDQLPVGRNSISWQVNAEPAVFLGGGRALLMQVAHPGIGAGVDEHSNFARDPWGRLFRTMDVMIKMNFGNPEVSARQVRMLEKMHRRVQGTTDLGDHYSAFDVDLQLWVWATLVDTALLIYERVRGPLSFTERERYYQESKLMAYGCGVPRGACPETWADFQTYVQRVVADDLRVTRSARGVEVAAMTPPVPGPLSALVAAENQLFTIGLMPPSLREAYGFTWDVARERRLARRFAVLGALSKITPAAVRHLGGEIAVRTKRPLRFSWLQRKGGEITERRLKAAGHPT